MRVLFITLVTVGCGGATASSASETPADASPVVDAAPEETSVSTPVDAAPETAVAKPSGDPITVTERETWVWVPIEGTTCGDGSPAGIGVNFTDASRELVVWFQGNGVCYDALTCNLYKGLLVGMGDKPLTQMWWGNDAVGHSGVFDRKDPANPLRNSNFIVFPHCSVDGHTADLDTDYPGVGTVHQHGYRNVTRALERIVPTFADATRIVVAGFSAGGIGATANYHQITTAFAPYSKVLPFLINDAGPILREPFLSADATSKLRVGWGLEKTIGTFCANCLKEGMGAIYETLAKTHPGLHSSQLCAYSDTVVTSLYRLLDGDINLFDTSKLKNGLLDHAAASATWGSSGPSMHRVYFYPSDQHGTTTVAHLPAPVATFLSAQLNDDSSWKSVVP